MASCTATAIPKVQKIKLAKSQHLSLFHSLSMDRCSQRKMFCPLKKDFGVYVQQNLREITHKACPMRHTVKYDFFFAIFKVSFKRYGEERGEGKKRKRDIQFLLSIVIGGLEQLEPLSESEFN